MATYNSGKFLREQLDSIIGQSFTDWTLYIRDDGSSDDTRTIIDEYETSHDNIIVIRDDKGNLGCRDNFFELLNVVDSNYYMFSDADDVWLPHKIESSYKAIKEIEKGNQNLPILVHTDLKVVDENLNEIYPSLWRAFRINPERMKRIEYLAIHCYIHGCTTLFNKHVKGVSMPFSRDVFLHDLWIGICTLQNNGIIYSIHEQTSLYRQHSLNVVGSPSSKDLGFLHKISNLHKIISVNLDVCRMFTKLGCGSWIKYVFYKTKLIFLIRSGKIFYM